MCLVRGLMEIRAMREMKRDVRGYASERDITFSGLVERDGLGRSM